LGAVGVVGCADDDGGFDQEALRAGFDAAVAAAAVSDVDGPDEATSKDVRYLTGTGRVDGDVDAAIEQVTSGLWAEGWEVSDLQPAGDGIAVVARDGNVAVQFAAFPRVGTNDAPEGRTFVQVQVAPIDAGFDWTPE
jgi:hypothetical protein